MGHAQWIEEEASWTNSPWSAGLVLLAGVCMPAPSPVCSPTSLSQGGLAAREPRREPRRRVAIVGNRAELSQNHCLMNQRLGTTEGREEARGRATGLALGILEPGQHRPRRRHDPLPCVSQIGPSLGCRFPHGDWILVGSPGLAVTCQPCQSRMCSGGGSFVCSRALTLSESSRLSPVSVRWLCSVAPERSMSGF